VDSRRHQKLLVEPALQIPYTDTDALITLCL
jgi:hypothetical protein